MIALAVIPCFAASVIVGGFELMRRGIGRARPGALFATGLLAALGLIGLAVGLLVPDGRCSSAAECGNDLTAVRDGGGVTVGFELLFAGLAVVALLFAVNNASHRRFRTATISVIAGLAAFAIWAILQAPFLAGA